MNHAKFIASAGAILLATSALTSAASAQVVFKSQAASPAKSQVSSSSYGGSSYYQAGSYAPSYAAANGYPGYVLAPQPTAPIPMPLPATYAAPAPTQYQYAPSATYSSTVAPSSLSYGAHAVAQPTYAGMTAGMAAGEPAASSAMMPYGMDPASSQAAPVPVVPQYVDHTHEYMEHEHAFVEHSHGYEQHQHSHEHPEARFVSDELADAPAELLEEEVVVEEIVVANDPIEEPYIEINPNIPDFELSDEVIVVDDAPYYGGPTRDNAMRLSVGYGYATAGNFNYGIEGNYTSESAVASDWTTTGGVSANNGTPWIDEELQHKGIYGSLKADAGNFFIDAVGGSYQVEDYAITQTFNLAEAYADSAASVGPMALVVDGSNTFLSGLYTYAAGDGIEVDEYDSMDVTATINSSINDFGGAAGYLINLSGVPLKVGIGVAGKSLNRTTTVDVAGVVNEVTTGELDSAYYLDHTYTEMVSGTYAGPALRVNFDPNVTSSISAHFGGSIQALYGTSTMMATQDYSGMTYTAEATDTGTMISGEIDAGLSFALSPNMRIGAGVFAGMTSGAPIVTAALDSTATDAADRVPTLGRGSWQNYGLKGSISASF